MKTKRKVGRVKKLDEVIYKSKKFVDINDVRILIQENCWETTHNLKESPRINTIKKFCKSIGVCRNCIYKKACEE